MRSRPTRQIEFSFDDDADAFEQVWTSLPSDGREAIARWYARMLVKAAKVAPTTQDKEEQGHDEQQQSD